MGLLKSFGTLRSTKEIMKQTKVMQENVQTHKANLIKALTQVPDLTEEQKNKIEGVVEAEMENVMLIQTYDSAKGSEKMVNQARKLF